jgi:hypothetical protein
MFGEILTGKEVEYCEQLRLELALVPWAQPILVQLAAIERFSYVDKPLLFELRMAGEINARGLSATYEASCGVGDSSVDFEINADGTKWRIELVSIATSDAVKRATVTSGIFFQAQLSSDSEDRMLSEEGEILLVQQKIGEKVLRGGTPTKFPECEPDTYHIILVDVRGFGLTGGDHWDYREIAYGPAGFSGQTSVLRHFWRTEDGALNPILGLFDKKNTKQRAAPLVRERIHLIGFCNDEDYSPGSLSSNAYYLANPHLFAGNNALGDLFQRYPLRPPTSQSSGDLLSV